MWQVRWCNHFACLLLSIIKGTPMPLYYSVDYNHLTNDGDYFIRIHPQGSASEAELAQGISEQIGHNVIAVKGMLEAFPTQLAQILASGKSAAIADFMGISVSARLQPGSKITDPNYVLRREDIELHININPKAALARELLNLLLEQKQAFIKVNNTAAKPLLTDVLDFATQKKNQYSPSSPLGLNGAHFSVPKQLNALPSECGVFFKLADKSEVRASIYSTYKQDEIHCLVPSSVSGTVSIILRQYNGNDLEETTLDNIAEST